MTCSACTFILCVRQGAIQENVTITLDDELLDAFRIYVLAHNTSLNNVIRESLKRIVIEESQAIWADDYLALADKDRGDSLGMEWKREYL